MQQPDLKKIAEGREAEIFAWEDGAVLKLYRELEARQPAIESASMTAAKAAGGPVPAARGTTTVNGRTGLIMDRVEGIDMLAQLSKKPWIVVRAGERREREAADRLRSPLIEIEAPDDQLLRLGLG